MPNDFVTLRGRLRSTERCGASSPAYHSFPSLGISWIRTHSSDRFDWEAGSLTLGVAVLLEPVDEVR